jgi:putative Mg2+ transporter-C (MgtC) family protein
LEWTLAWHDELFILLKLGISAFLGLIIGLEREIKRKPVGLKTSLVISIISCMLTIVSIESAFKFSGSDELHITMDPLRLAAQIVSGIGFIGAGVILHRDNSISGLTTAAIIWGAAGIGIAVGAGFFFEAIVGVILLIISVEFVPGIISLIGPSVLRQKEILLNLVIEDKNAISKVLEEITKEDISVKNLRIEDIDENKHALTLRILVNQRRKTSDVYYTISNIEEVSKVVVENI